MFDVTLCVLGQGWFLLFGINAAVVSIAKKVPSPLPVMAFSFYVCLDSAESHRVLRASPVCHKEVEIDPPSSPSLARNYPASFSPLPLLFDQGTKEMTLIN